MKTTLWLRAARLRTLPLALTSVCMGAALALFYQKFDTLIFAFSILTTTFLQILSNFANDYGDFVSGVDGHERQGPKRTVQAGDISAKQMQKAMALFVLLSLISGITLLYIAFFINPSARSWQFFILFLGLGVLAIVAAIAYTVGKKPYGYAGLGDISVLVFFGWIAVVGVFFLYTKTLEWFILLPATTCGLLSVAVLNINNIRDIDSDRKSGKNSIPVRLGREKAVLYHYSLLILALTTAIIFAFLHFNYWYQYFFLLTTPLFLVNARAVSQLGNMALDPYLKQMALTALLFVLCFAISINLG